VAVRVKTKDDFPLDPDAPRLQTMLRYTATGSERRNDMQIFPLSLNAYTQSAGELRLNPNGPHEQMFINRRYLEHPRDRQRLREGVRIILDMMEHESFNGVVEELISPVEADLASDDTLGQWLLENVWIGQHLSGTYEVGSDSEEMAVVDQYGRVRGIQGLRVADASNHARLHPSQH